MGWFLSRGACFGIIFCQASAFIDSANGKMISAFLPIAERYFTRRAKPLGPQDREWVVVRMLELEVETVFIFGLERHLTSIMVAAVLGLPRQRERAGELVAPTDKYVLAELFLVAERTLASGDGANKQLLGKLWTCEQQTLKQSSAKNNKTNPKLVKPITQTATKQELIRIQT